MADEYEVGELMDDFGEAFLTMEIGCSYSAMSAEKLASNEGALTEILSRLPVRSLFRFECVSKTWQSLISDPKFRALHSRTYNNRRCSAFLLKQNIQESADVLFPYDVDNHFHYFPIRPNGDNLAPPPYLSELTHFLRSWDGIILDSCNGLLLWKERGWHRDQMFNLILCNPTTKETRRLPIPADFAVEEITHFYLAFDPVNLTDCHVVCYWKPLYDAHSDPTISNVVYRLYVYSLQPDQWRVSLEVLLTTVDSFHMSTGRGVYCNKKIYWQSEMQPSEKYGFFDLETENLVRFSASCDIWTGGGNRITRNDYFGGLAGRIHLVQSYVMFCRVEYVVLELEDDTLTWSFKSSVSLDRIGHQFIDQYRFYLARMEQRVYAPFFSVLGIVGGEGDEDAKMVVLIPGKVVSYNLETEALQYLGKGSIPINLAEQIFLLKESLYSVKRVTGGPAV